MSQLNAATPNGQKTITDTWLTPPDFLLQLGGASAFDLDPCAWSHPERGILHPCAKESYYLPMDGLTLPWFGNVWCNPPYSDLPNWLEKMANHGHGMVLCFARTDTRAFQKHITTATGINFIKGRPRFLDAEGVAKSNGNAASCLICWGEDNLQRAKNIAGFVVRLQGDNL